MRYVLVAAAFAFLLFTLPGQALAQTCPDDPTDPEAGPAAYSNMTKRQAFDKLAVVQEDCHTNAFANSDAASRAFSGLPANQATTLLGYLQSLEVLASDAQKDVSAICVTAGPECDYARAYQQRMSRVHASADALAEAYGAKGDNSLPARTINADEADIGPATKATSTQLFDIVIGMKSDPQGERRQAELPLLSVCAFVFSGKLSGEECAAQGSLAALEATPCDPQCAARAAQVARSFRRITAASMLYRGGAMRNTSLKYENDQNVLNAAKWNSYWFGGGEGRVQWPWEIYINGMRYKAAQDSDGRFVPPNDAWIIAHPGLGATLYDREGKKIELAAVLEIIGYSTWDYDGKTGARKNEWGGSVIAAYAQSETADDWGYGLLVRTPFKGVNVSWVQRDSPTGKQDALMFSLDVNDLAKSFLSPEGACKAFKVSVPGVCAGQ